MTFEVEFAIQWHFIFVQCRIKFTNSDVLPSAFLNSFTDFIRQNDLFHKFQNNLSVYDHSISFGTV